MANRSPTKRTSPKRHTTGVAPTRTRRRNPPTPMAAPTSTLADKQRVYDLLEELPVESLSEVLYFLEFLRFKAAPQQSRRIVKLRGLWADTLFDVNNEDIRQLRHEVTEHLDREEF